jgi:tetratricopeptide (TPR) repeat protein
MHWEKLRADFPEVPEDREGLAHLHHSWGSLLLTTNRLQEAEQEFRKVLELRERLVADEPGNSELKHLLAQIHDYLGYLLLQRRKRAEGVLAQRLTEEAEHQFRRCVQLCETLIEDFPDTPDYRRRLVAAYSHLSEPLMLMGRVQEAIGAVRRAISEDDKLITNSSQADESYLGAGRSYHRLGVLLQAEGRVQEAADAFREAKNRLERAATRNPRGSLWLRTLAFFLATCPAAQFRDVDRAITLARQALQLAPLVPDSWYVLGLAEYRAGHWAAAIEAFEKSAKLGWVLDAQAAFFLAMAHWQLDHKNEARQWYDQAVGLIERPNWPTEDLPRLRAEAAKLLGLPEPTAPERKEVPRPTRD